MSTVRTIESSPEFSHVAIDGRLDIDGVGAIDTALTVATVTRGKPVMLDMSAVEFLGSLGIGMLVRCAVSLQRRGARVVLFGCQPLIRKTLETTKVTSVLPIVDTEADARQLLATA